jgi:hypothetical protein
VLQRSSIAFVHGGYFLLIPPRIFDILASKSNCMVYRLFLPTPSPIMDPVYSRDECIAAICDYYEFLATMFMDRSCIVEPPQGGWPSITAGSMQGMRKTEKVIQLLKHMPYIADRPLSNHAEGSAGLYI